MSKTLSLRSPTHACTQSIGRCLGTHAEAGDVFALVGPLGAGKTCLAQGILHGLGVTGYLPSPTFTLVREYRGRVPCHHIDLYRLESPEQVEALGIEECFDGAVAIIEWAERAAGLLPADHLVIALRAEADETREIRLDAAGPRSWRLVEAVRSDAG